MQTDNYLQNGGPVSWNTPHFGGNLATDHTNEINFDEYIDRSIYETTPAPEDRGQSTPDSIPSLGESPGPSPTDSFDIVPTPTPLAGPAPHIVAATSAQNGEYFPTAEEADPLERSISKKRPSRTLTNLSTFMHPRKKSQRKKKCEGGFPCHGGCGKTFDRECDETKHFERSHRDESYWPHECLRCSKRSQYPKDVWRHLSQTHGLIVPPKQPASLRKNLGCPCCSKAASDWLERNNLTIAPVVASPIATEPSSPTSPNILWTLTNAITKLRRLSLKSKEASVVKEPKFIMVTTDKSHFVEVDVSGINKAGALVKSIMSRVATPKKSQLASAQSYTRAFGLGPNLNFESLLNLVSKSADAEGTLKLFVTTR